MGTTIPGNIVSADAPIEVDVPIDANVEVSDVTMTATTHAVTGATFTIKNIYPKDIISYSMLVSLYWDKYPNDPRQFAVNEDGWFLNQYVLHSGQSKIGTMRTALSPTEPMKLTHVNLTLQYVEFADGTIGGSDPSLVRPKLLANRQKKLELQQKYVNQLKSGQSADAVASHIQSDQVSFDSQSQLAIGILRSVLNYEGSEGLAKLLLATPAALPK